MAERTNIDVVLRLRDNATKKIRSAIKLINRSVMKATRALLSWKTAFLAIGAAAVTGKFTKGILDTAAAFETTEVMLTRLYGSAERGRTSLDFLVEFGARVPFGMRSVQNAMVKLRVAGLDPMQGSLQSLTNAVAAFGGTDDALNRASVAIEQIAGKGVISMEELRRQLGEAIPTAVRILAREMKLSFGELVKLISTGGLRADVGLKALFEGFEKDFSGATDQMAGTWTGLLKQLGVQWTLFQKDIATAGVFQFFKQQAQELLATIRSLRQDGTLAEWADQVALAMLRGIQSILQFSKSVIALFKFIDEKVRGSDTAFYEGRLKNLREEAEELRQFLLNPSKRGVSLLDQFKDILNKEGGLDEDIARVRGRLADVVDEIANVTAELNVTDGPADALLATMEKLEKVISNIQADAHSWAEAVNEVARIESSSDFTELFPTGTPSDTGSGLRFPRGPGLPGDGSDQPFGDFQPQSFLADFDFRDVVSELYEDFNTQQTNFIENSIIAWEDWGKSLQETWGNVGANMRSLITGVVDSFADGVARALVTGQSLAAVFKSIFQGIAQEIISTVIKMVALKIIQYFIDMNVRLATAAAMTYANAFASSVAFLGPGAAAYATGMVALMKGGAAAALASGGISGQLHDGIGSVPREGTFLLDEGERVVKRNQNEDLTDFLEGEGGTAGGGGRVMQVHMHLNDREVGVAIADMFADGRIPT